MTTINAIKELRVKQGLTQKQLADQVGLTQSQVARIERGDSGLTAKILIRIANALGVDAGAVLGSIKDTGTGIVPAMEMVDELVFERNYEFKDKFSAKVVDNSCTPILKAGYTIFVDTKQTPKKDELVLLVIDDKTIEKLVCVPRFLVSVTKKEVIVRTTQPEKTETYSRKAIKFIHRITTIQF